MINAAITPGTQPHIVKMVTITIEPQPLSSTASGGKIIDNNTLHILIRYKITIKINYRSVAFGFVTQRLHKHFLKSKNIIYLTICLLIVTPVTFNVTIVIALSY